MHSEETKKNKWFYQCLEILGFILKVHSFFKVRASESLMKLISDIKQYLILNDFPSVNEAIADNSKRFLELEVRQKCKNHKNLPLH